MGDIGRLHPDIISHIFSLTSAKDAARASATSTLFRAASNSDITWLNFLPPDLPDIISRLDPHHAHHLLQYPSSNKDLYLSLCEPRLIDGGRRLFWLDKLTGKKCYHLSARELQIVWGENHHYWRWVDVEGRGDQAGWPSFFSEVAELLQVCWLLISAELDTQLLAPRTRYGAYLVLRLDIDSYGLTSWVLPTVSVTLGDQVSTNKALLAHGGDAHNDVEEEQEENYWDDRIVVVVDEEEGRGEGEAVVLRERGDGWLELELGEFFNEAGEDGAVKMELRETEGGHWKKGLIIHGIEIRPKTANT